MSAASTLTSFYARFLKLYPRAFLAEFGQEMMSVFSACLEEASMKDTNAVLATGLREAGGAIAGSVREHLRKRSPLPDHIVLRSTLGFALGWTLLIVLRAVLPPLYITAAPNPPLIDPGLLREMVGFAVMGLSVAGLLGYTFGRGDGRVAGVLRSVVIALGFALAGGVGTVFIRTMYGVTGYQTLFPWGLVFQTAAEVFVGASAGALLGGTRWGVRGAVKLAVLGGVAFAVSFLAMEAILGLARTAYESFAQRLGQFGLLLFATPFGAAVGALLGIALRRQEASRPPAEVSAPA